MNGSKHISNCYSALQGLYWMSYGAIYTFAAVVLLDRNFTDSQVGTLIALACVFSAVFQPFAAALLPPRLRQLTGESGFLCGL